MTKALRVAVVMGSAVAALASATAPQRRAIESSRAIPASQDATWDAVIDLFAERNWAIKNVDRASGIITTDWMNLGNEADRYADCGGSGLALEHATQVVFNVRVRDNGKHAAVEVNASFRQHRSFDGVPSVADCASKGEVERLIHSAVAEKAPQIDKRRAAKQPAPVAPKPFFCTAAPADATVAACARSEAGCAKRQADIVATAGDATPCASSASAFCFKGTNASAVTIESCHGTQAACDKAKLAASDLAAPTECVETR